ncbi:2,3-bisphosphoglycerate-dependent phosphoglycerate mutase [Rhodoligotrophos appendicifer]|uniref:2,3-bisphosphoglycerate-dependent phosphoglycerate mutase n=1 Tax=Rhodoligotrophos appendicifer TaxID=987056 RepID=UPI00117CBFBB|nr:2,3-bisphosphoglycerate-dependent phosphoglycerate mutase [Rhodoligotrophos appendicifer]
MDHLLVLVRHGQSEWNLKNLFTGWADPDLTDLGRSEAEDAGKRLKALGLSFDVAFTSMLKRAQNTCQYILAALGQEHLQTVREQALNERDYGDLTGLNKDQAREKWGKEQVFKWRRSFDIPPPGGESLKDTAARVIPYYESAIVPRLRNGERVLVVAHGNSLRALIMHLENLPGEEIAQRELATGIPIIYRLDGELKVKTREEVSGQL